MIAIRTYGMFAIPLIHRRLFILPKGGAPSLQRRKKRRDSLARKIPLTRLRDLKKISSFRMKKEGQKRASLSYEVWEEEKPYGKKEDLLSRGFIPWPRERVKRLRGARFRAPIFHAGFVICVYCNSAFLIFPLGKLELCPVCRRKTFEVATVNRAHPFNRLFRMKKRSSRKGSKQR